jgi:hypothetical protein
MKMARFVELEKSVSARRQNQHARPRAFPRNRDSYCITTSSNEPDHLTPVAQDAVRRSVLREACRGPNSGEKFWAVQIFRSIEARDGFELKSVAERCRDVED